MHRDLKLENILLGEDGYLRISDFGLSKIMKDLEHTMTKNIGTAVYMAPEMQDRSYTKDIDWWSVGIIAYELLVGNPPFGGNDRQLRKSIKNDPISWEGVNCTDEFKDLIEKLLKK